MSDREPPAGAAGDTPAGTRGDIALRPLPAAPYLCLTTRGPYWKLSGTFARIRSSMSAGGLVAVGPAMGVFFDDPDVTPPEECRYSICYPLSEADAERAAAPVGSLSPEAEADVPTLVRAPETTVAAVEYAGPAAESPAVYAALDRWVREQGLTPAGPPREVYLAEPGTAGKGMMHAEVQQPVSGP